MINNLKNVKPNEIIPGYFGKFFHGDNMTIAFWTVKKNAKIPIHSHHHEQCLFVKKGEFELILDNKKKLLNSNDLIIIPSNKDHSGRAITECELIDFFSPSRKEYRNE